MKLVCILLLQCLSFIAFCQNDNWTKRDQKFRNDISRSNNNQVPDPNTGKTDKSQYENNSDDYWNTKVNAETEKYNKKASKARLAKRFESININIAKAYAPILNFHPKEGMQCCYPSCAEKAYPRARFGKTGEHRVPSQLNPDAPCYFEAFYTNEGFRLKYWFWYNYNDYPTGPNIGGSHPGDWEYIEIFFRNDLPYRYHFSNHKSVRIKSPDEVIISSGKLQVWCANGSHANYESPNPGNLYSYLFFHDEVKDGGSIWNTENNLVYVMNTNFGSDNFQGDWGDGKKIFGPLGRTNE